MAHTVENDSIRWPKMLVHLSKGVNNALRFGYIDLDGKKALIVAFRITRAKSNFVSVQL